MATIYFSLSAQDNEKLIKHMQAIPKDIWRGYVELLKRRAVPAVSQGHYLKWLRYYLDFFSKYGHPDLSSKSIQPFLRKLGDKKQTRDQLKQAAHAHIALSGHGNVV
jgi:predicted phosphoadenosine phosphosulfate sulfurtransferase